MAAGNSDDDTRVRSPRGGSSVRAEEEGGNIGGIDPLDRDYPVVSGEQKNPRLSGILYRD